jgi:hypothetical protein
MNGLKWVSDGWLQKVTGVPEYGMAGCAGQTHHLTPPNNIHVPHLFDSEQQMTTVNVSTYMCTSNGVLGWVQTDAGAYAVPSEISAGGSFQVVKRLWREGVNWLSSTEEDRMRGSMPSFPHTSLSTGTTFHLYYPWEKACNYNLPAKIKRIALHCGPVSQHSFYNLVTVMKGKIVPEPKHNVMNTQGRVDLKLLWYYWS